MERIGINVHGGYYVNIGAGLLDRCGELIAEAVRTRKAVVVTDDTVAGLYLDRCVKSLEKSGFTVSAFTFPHGEESKNIGTISDMLEFFASEHLTRSDIAIALGGGVTGDMTGFAAGVYLRGIKYAQVPTTLLADVDSSVGGKTAVNLKAGKNLAGVFLQPVTVVCDTDALGTLSPQIFADGAAESIKYGVLFDTEIFDIFENGNVKENLPNIISRCVRLKGDIVEHDEYDTGDRRFLNLGHTIGHGIERLSNYTFPHGHAVAVGMVMISRAGEKLGITESGTADRIARVLERNNLPVSVDYNADNLYKAALGDKKRSGGEITIVVPERVGKCVLKTIPIEQLHEIISLGLGE